MHVKRTRLHFEIHTCKCINYCVAMWIHYSIWQIITLAPGELSQKCAMLLYIQVLHQKHSINQTPSSDPSQPYTAMLYRQLLSHVASQVWLANFALTVVLSTNATWWKDCREFLILCSFWSGVLFSLYIGNVLLQLPCQCRLILDEGKTDLECFTEDTNYYLKIPEFQHEVKSRMGPYCKQFDRLCYAI